jgi:hypothetical protein
MIFSERWVFWHFQKLFVHKKRVFQEKWIRLRARPIHAVSRTPLLFIYGHFVAWFLPFGMPTAIHARKCLEIKSRGELEKSHLWHAGMHLKNAKSVDFMFFLGPRLHNWTNEYHIFPNGYKFKSQ